MYVSLSNFCVNLLALGVVSFAGAQGPSQVDLNVKTSTGTYAGIINGTVPNVRQFLNVPFALPPTGPRRWLPLVKPTSDESTVIDATNFPLFCPQYLSSNPNVYNQLLPGYLIPRGPLTGINAYMPTTTGEDCLYLSIWTPTGDVFNLPVIVFMTGGEPTDNTTPELPAKFHQAVSSSAASIFRTSSHITGYRGRNPTLLFRSSLCLPPSKDGQDLYFL